MPLRGPVQFRPRGERIAQAAKQEGGAANLAAHSPERRAERVHPAGTGQPTRFELGVRGCCQPATPAAATVAGYVLRLLALPPFVRVLGHRRRVDESPGVVVDPGPPGHPRRSVLSRPGRSAATAAAAASRAPSVERQRVGGVGADWAWRRRTPLAAGHEQRDLLPTAHRAPPGCSPTSPIAGPFAIPRANASRLTAAGHAGALRERPPPHELAGVAGPIATEGGGVAGVEPKPRQPGADAGACVCAARDAPALRCAYDAALRSPGGPGPTGGPAGGRSRSTCFSN